MTAIEMLLNINASPSSTAWLKRAANSLVGRDKDKALAEVQALVVLAYLLRSEERTALLPKD